MEMPSLPDHRNDSEDTGLVRLSGAESLKRYLSDQVRGITRLDFSGDTIHPQTTIQEIRKTVEGVIGNTDIPATISRALDEYHSLAMLHAFCAEKTLITDESSPEKYHVSPICVIYNNDGSIRFLNGAYIEASGIRNLPKEKLASLVGEELASSGNYSSMIKQMSRETIMHPEVGKVSKWYATIYGGKDLQNVMRRVGALDLIPGYKDIFTMSLTGKAYKWVTLNIDGIAGNIRTAIPLAPGEDFIPTSLSNRGNLIFFPIGALEVINRYRQLVDETLQICEKQVGHLGKLWEDARQNAIVFQTVFDRSLYPMRISDRGANSFNMAYSECAGYSPDVLMRIMKGTDFTPLVYGDSVSEHGDVYLKDVRSHFASLLHKKSYSNLFYPKRLGVRRAHAFTTIRYDEDPNSSEDISDHVTMDAGCRFISTADSLGNRAGEPYPLSYFTLGCPHIPEKPESVS